MYTDDRWEAPEILRASLVKMDPKGLSGAGTGKSV